MRRRTARRRQENVSSREARKRGNDRPVTGRSQRLDRGCDDRDGDRRAWDLAEGAPLRIMCGRRVVFRRRRVVVVVRSRATHMSCRPTRFDGVKGR